MVFVCPNVPEWKLKDEHENHTEAKECMIPRGGKATSHFTSRSPTPRSTMRRAPSVGISILGKICIQFCHVLSKISNGAMSSQFWRYARWRLGCVNTAIWQEEGSRNLYPATKPNRTFWSLFSAGVITTWACRPHCSSSLSGRVSRTRTPCSDPRAAAYSRAPCAATAGSCCPLWWWLWLSRYIGQHRYHHLASWVVKTRVITG